MVCRSTPGNSAATTLARATSGLHDVQVLSLFHEVRSEAPRSTTPPDAREVAHALLLMEQDAEVQRANDVLSAARHTQLRQRIENARTETPDGRTYYAWRNIRQRAIYARTAMDTHFQEVARRHNSTPAEVENAFNQMMRRDYRINGAEPEAPEHVEFSTANLPHDRRTRHALAMLYQGGPSVAHDAALATLVYPATHINSRRIAAEQETNPANNCPDCGQFAGDDHVCPHVDALNESHLNHANNPLPPEVTGRFEAAPLADWEREILEGPHNTEAQEPEEIVLNPIAPAVTDAQAQEALDALRSRLYADSEPAVVHEEPSVESAAEAPTVEPTSTERATVRATSLGTGGRTPMRSYASDDGNTVRTVNVSAVRGWFRDNPDGILSLDDVTVGIPSVDGRSAGTVTGTMSVTATAARRSRNRDRFTVDNDTTDASQGRGLRCTCPDYARNYDCIHLRQATENVQALLNQRDAVAVAPAAAMEAVTDEIRADHDASLAAAQEARASFNAEAASPASVSYADDMSAFQAAWDEAKTNLAESHRLPYQIENATNGLGARDGGRSFGIEIEVDFPEDMTFEAKNRVARAIYEAGLSDSDQVRGWHHAARAGNRRAEMGSGYTDNPNRWTVEFDRSVDNVGGQRGCEIVSPIMYDTPETWRNLKTICDIVEANGGKVTPRTGLHINVGAADFNHTVGNHNRLIGLANSYEDVLVRSAHNPQAGPRHRGRDYCRPMSMPSEGFSSIRAAQRGLDPQNYEGSSHRAMINLDHVPAEREPIRNSTRVEVRVFDGAIDPGRIQANVKLSLGLVNAAVRGAEVPDTVERAGTHRAANVGANGRMRRLSGQAWESDTASFRRLMDTVFTREEDKRQLTYAFAASRWQQQ